MIDKLEDVYFSQAALAAYQTCPLKFRYRYLDNLGWLRPGPDEGKQTERLLGEQFHILAQRYFQRVDLTALRQSVTSGVLVEWFNNLTKRFPLESNVCYYPEQEIRVNQQGLKLMAKYDLLAAHTNGRVVIYDWKTPAKPLKNSPRTLQGKIYPLVLWEAALHGITRQEAITMVFWNPRFPDQEQVLGYDQLLYLADREEVTKLISTIRKKEYRDFYGIKPEVGEPPKDCGYCEFKLLCYDADEIREGTRAELELDGAFDWDSIIEIPYKEA